MVNEGNGHEALISPLQIKKLINQQSNPPPITPSLTPARHTLFCCFLRCFHEYWYTDVSYKDTREEIYSYMLSNTFKNGQKYFVLF